MKGVVSVHGGLMPFDINADEISPRVLVLSGGDDDTYTDVSVLQDTLDSAGNVWEVTRYSDVEHGFTVIDSGKDMNFITLISNIANNNISYSLNMHNAWVD